MVAAIEFCGGIGNMSQPPDAGEILEAAERAAAAGDFAAAGELLRNAAHLQETTLGPFHPDLASTLNNLAVVSEKTGRQDDAEMFYRRAAAIASAALPADHPMVAQSRQNLEDFCRSSGLPIDPPPEATTASPTEITFPPDGPSSPFPAPGGASKRLPDVPPVPSKASNSLTWGAVGVAILVMALFLTQWRSTERSTPPPESAVTAPAVEPQRHASDGSSASTAAVKDPRATRAAPQGNERGSAHDGPPVPAGGPLTLAAAELCETFSTREDDWQCKRAGGSVAPGRIVMYTRVKSTRDNIVMHRWFLDEALQQSVRLMTRANETDGYRTFSRQSVSAGQHWRVEVRSADGALLHEQRFSVR